MSFERFMSDMLTPSLTGQRDWRNEALTKEFDDWIIDTCYTPDTQRWETGIKFQDGDWVIVEHYLTEEKSEKGHKKWIKKIKKNLEIKLKHCITPEDWATGNY